MRAQRRIRLRLHHLFDPIQSSPWRCSNSDTEATDEPATNLRDQSSCAFDILAPIPPASLSMHTNAFWSLLVAAAAAAADLCSATVGPHLKPIRCERDLQKWLANSIRFRRDCWPAMMRQQCDTILSDECPPHWTLDSGPQFACWLHSSSIGQLFSRGQRAYEPTRGVVKH